MPLTTPPDSLADYNGDSEHFVHVLEHLFVPAVEAAGYQAVRPLMTGADLMQAEIIRNLETADLVLCDISRHNPNVFFELGIRTSLDRPVALVRDNKTSGLPFDTGIPNTYTYDPSLSPWTLQAQIVAMADHITKSAERSRGSNPMWKYFGLTRRAEADAPSGDPVQDKLDLIMSAMAELRTPTSRRLGGFSRPLTSAEPDVITPESPDVKWIFDKAPGYGLDVKQVATMQDGRRVLTVDSRSNTSNIGEFVNAADAAGIRISVIQPT